MKIIDHWLEGVKRDPITSQGPMPVRRCLVIHFTSGASAASSVTAMRERGVSAHIAIDRDGAITQCVPFNEKAAHAGRSRWQDPKTGQKFGTANAYAIGIELANAGDDSALALRWTKLPLTRAKHRNGGPVESWEAFPAAQVAACTEVARAVVERYNLDDITGHDCIAPERKNDPGPAFPMEILRRACGFTGLPTVHTA